MKTRNLWAGLGLVAGLCLALGQGMAAENNAWSRAHGAGSTERKPVFADPIVVTTPPASVTNPAGLEGLVNPRLVTNAAGPLSVSPAGPVPAASAPPASWGQNITMDQLDNLQKLQKRYQLIFRVREDQEVPQFLMVTDTGELDVPELGLVPVVGKTCRGLAYELKKKLEQSTYIQATVLLGIQTTPPSSGGRIYVTGLVQRPGLLEIPGGEPWTVAKAVIRAGGVLPTGDAKHVRLTRLGKSGAPTQTVLVDVAEVWKKGRTDKDLPVEAEDLIYVPQAFIKFK